MSRAKNNKLELSEKSLLPVNRYVKLIAGYVAIQQIDKIVTSDERKAIWSLCSGKLTRDQIASESGVSLRTVTTFIEIAKQLGLVEEEKDKGGHALRVIDYCPPEWKEFVKAKKMKKEPKQKEKDANLLNA